MTDQRLEDLWAIKERLDSERALLVREMRELSDLLEQELHALKDPSKTIEAISKCTSKHDELLRCLQEIRKQISAEIDAM